MTDWIYCSVHYSIASTAEVVILLLVTIIRSIFKLVLMQAFGSCVNTTARLSTIAEGDIAEDLMKRNGFRTCKLIGFNCKYMLQ
jgi:hypothetical protein